MRCLNPECGKEFTVKEGTGYNTRRYCSDACIKKAKKESRIRFKLNHPDYQKKYNKKNRKRANQLRRENRNKIRDKVNKVQREYLASLPDFAIKKKLRDVGIYNPNKEDIEKRRNHVIIRREIRTLTLKIKSYEKQRNTPNIL